MNIVERTANIKLAWQTGDLETIIHMKNEGVNIRTYMHLFNACKSGNMALACYSMLNLTDDNYKYYAISGACINNHISIVKWLLGNSTHSHPEMNISLVRAIEHGHLGIVKYLVERGANIHKDEELPLRTATRHGYLHMVKYFVENGAEVNNNNRNICALSIAVVGGNLQIVEYLIQHGAELRFLKQNTLDHALRNGHKHVIKYLLKHMHPSW